MAASVRDNSEKSRFELDMGNEIAFANYRLTPEAVSSRTQKRRALYAAEASLPSSSKARWN
jgi:uncharacterized protein